MTDMQAFEHRIAAALEARADEIDDRVDAAAVAARVARLPRTRWPWLSLGGPVIEGTLPRRWALVGMILVLLALGVAMVGGPLLLPPEPAPLLTPTIVDVVAPAIGDELAFVSASDGAIWRLGSGRLTRLDPATGGARTWDVADDVVFHASAIAPARDGGVWLAGPSGIVRFDGAELGDRIASPSVDQVSGLAETVDGTLWAASDALYRRDANGTWTRFALDRPDAWPGRMTVDLEGRPWVVSNLYPGPEAFQLARLDAGGWTVFGQDDSPGLDQPIGSLVALANGGVLVGAQAGVASFDGASWTSLGAPSVPGRLVDWWTAIEGPDGRIWAAMEGTGDPVVARLDPAGWRVYSLADGLPAGDGYITLRLAATRSDVVASVAGAPYRFAADAWQPMSGVQAGPAGTSGLRVVAVTREEAWGIELRWDETTPATGLWHLTAGGARLEPGSASLAVPSDLALLPEGPITASRAGVALWTGSAWAILDPRPAAALTVGPDGRIWVVGLREAPTRVLARDGAGWRSTDLPDPPVVPNDGVRIAVDPRGDAWVIGTGWVPIRMARLHDGDWEAVEPMPGCQLSAHDIAVAPNGDVWVSIAGLETPSRCRDPRASGMRIGRYDGHEWTFFGRSDGVPEFNPVSLAVTPDGRVWLAGDSLYGWAGERWTEYLPGTYPVVIAASPDGALWASGLLGTVRIDLSEP